MKVKELIEKLKEFPEDSNIIIKVGNTILYELDFIHVSVDNQLGQLVMSPKLPITGNKVEENTNFWDPIPIWDFTQGKKG